MAGGSRVGRLVEDMLKRALFVVATCVGLALYASLDAFGLDDPPPTGAVDPASTSTGVRCNRLACGPNAYDEGSPGTSTTGGVGDGHDTGVGNDTTSTGGSESGVAAGSPAVAPDPCPWMAVEVLGASSSWWGGNDPTTGHVEINKCATGPPVSAYGGPSVVTRFVPNATGGGPA